MTRDSVHYENGIEYHDSFLISEKHISQMEGKILTLIDLVGIDEKRASVLKKEIQQKIWGATFLHHAYPIQAEQVPDIWRKYIAVPREAE